MSFHSPHSMLSLPQPHSSFFVQSFSHLCVVITIHSMTFSLISMSSNSSHSSIPSLSAKSWKLPSLLLARSKRGLCSSLKALRIFHPRTAGALFLLNQWNHLRTMIMTDTYLGLSVLISSAMPSTCQLSKYLSDKWKTWADSFPPPPP